MDRAINGRSDENLIDCPLKHSLTQHDSFSDSIDSRRAFFQKGAGIASAFVGGAAANAYSVPDLNYPFEALEPYIDAPTMKIHHDKHHGT